MLIEVNTSPVKLAILSISWSNVTLFGCFIGRESFAKIYTVNREVDRLVDDFPNRCFSKGGRFESQHHTNQRTCCRRLSCYFVQYKADVGQNRYTG